MYPRPTDLFQDLFGFNLPLPIYSFGFMVATAIVIATVLSKREFDRMYGLGQLSSVQIKEKDKKGREKTVSVSPSALVWTMMLIAAGVGIAGSKLFHIIDHWDRFAADPMGLIFNPAGLTFYGGLISAAIALALYARKKELPFFPVDFYHPEIGSHQGTKQEMGANFPAPLSGFDKGTRRHLIERKV